MATAVSDKAGIGAKERKLPGKKGTSTDILMGSPRHHNPTRVCAPPNRASPCRRTNRARNRRSTTTTERLPTSALRGHGELARIQKTPTPTAVNGIQLTFREPLTQQQQDTHTLLSAPRTFNRPIILWAIEQFTINLKGFKSEKDVEKIFKYLETKHTSK